jgi:GNAT superfamily N-acetyltransferase
MNQPLIIRPPLASDYAAWRPLWDGYNAFYCRSGPTALPEEVSATLWQRLFDPAEPVFALVAEQDGALLGITHYLFHRSTSRIAPVCYLQDLFTAEAKRGQGVARQLIAGVDRAAHAAGCTRVYWQTHVQNHTARALYDKVAQHHGFIVYGHEV